MATTTNTDKVEVKPESEVIGVLAEFSTADELVAAAEKMQQKGFRNLEAFSPFPIHGIDAVLGIRPSRLPWFVLVAGIAGGIAALAFQWWANAVDYPYLISGKPLFSLPANIPVTFEVIIFAAAFAAFFGMLFINGLPKLANPLLRNQSFRSATKDGFFLLASSEDSENQDQATTLLQELGAKTVENLFAIDQSQRLPRGILMVGAVLGALALIPPVVIASARATTSDKPRLHNFFDMDFQPKAKSQTTSNLFVDGRAMRPRVPGTIPRGELRDDSSYYFGVESTDHGTEQTSHDDQVSDVAADEPNWVDEIPIPVTTELMVRGKQRYNIHCSVCHGRAGEGNGLASLRALELEQGTWVPPTSIHAEHVRKQPDGQLFNTITNGVRKMPAYGHQIDVEDRWAIVLYLRALQRSQNASIEDVPSELQRALRETN